MRHSRAPLAGSRIENHVVAMSSLPSLAEIESAAVVVNQAVPPTPHFNWPLLSARAGCELWVKHDNHTAVGSFKLRGAIHYVTRLLSREPGVRGVIAATRGNFGQAIAFAARRHGLAAVVVVPHGNSPEKNRAMRALGAELIEHGDDFQAALEFSGQLAAQRKLHWVPSFHRDLACGNAVSALAFLRGAPPLDVVYVPLGMGSGVCAMLAARAALGGKSKIVAVVSAHAPAYALSFETRRRTTHPASSRVADGVACSTTDPEALEEILHGVVRVVRVTDDEVEAALRAYFSDTHNVAEGAAGVALAGVLQDRAQLAGQRVGVVFTGGNIDAAAFARVLAAG
jgi:threonine dehydratase